MKVLGEGDVGKALLVHDDKLGDIVLKEVAVKNAAAKKQLHDEVCIGKILGDAGIGPRVFDDAPWYCKGNGYYRMEQMAGTWASMLPTSKEWAKKKGKARPISLAMVESEPYKKLEQQVVGVLERMISMGVVHGDNHPDNTGIIKVEGGYHVVMFDFGFSLGYEIPQALALQVLLGQLYIFLEHYDDAIFTSSYILDVIYEIRQNKYVWGSHAQYIGKPVAIKLG
jgi:serine/threonine protein kinase